MHETIAEVGELALIERLKPYCADVVGDDGALVTVEPGHRLVVTTDVLVDEVHFSDRTTPPHSVGWRSVAASLSDIAAMGGAPLGITIGLGLPPQTSWQWVKELYRGMADCLDRYGGAMVGGDLCRANQRTVSITAMGQVQPERAIYRHTAKPGMSVVITGVHGLSRAGLASLVASEAPVDEVRARWIRAHQYPVPRFDAIAHLQNIAQTIDPYPTVAGMDSSDGLANALLQISQCSQVGLEIHRSQLPISQALIDFAGAEKSLEWALYGGEDFELVLCVPSAVADRLVEKVEGAIAIGTVTETNGVCLLASDGSSQIVGHQSFQHF